tara:strand:+ start:331 stop:474 length:144 start_codon:yes stop_codon:yes gene_type:complete
LPKLVANKPVVQTAAAVMIAKLVHAVKIVAAMDVVILTTAAEYKTCF